MTGWAIAIGLIGLLLAAAGTAAAHRSAVRARAARQALLRARTGPRAGSGQHTWSLPAEPGREVTAVRCSCCRWTWTRVINPDPNGSDAWIAPGFGGLGRLSWRALVADHSEPEYPLAACGLVLVKGGLS